MAMTFFDLLGVASAGEAAALLSLPDAATAQYLQDHLEVHGLRPGASADGVGFVAELQVTSNTSEGSLAFPGVPDVRFVLQLTSDTAPARLFVTRDAAGAVEWVIESLPVEIQLPAAVLESPTTEDVTYPDEFYEISPTDVDGLKIELHHLDPASIFVRVKVRRTREGRFVFEPAVPISIGPCKLFSLPCRAIHDLTILPSSSLGTGHTDRELPLEWTRHTLNRFPATGPTTGQLLIRTVDFDGSRPPLTDLYRALTGDRADASALELVLEDVALPISPGLASVPFVPTHARVGVRRNTVAATDPHALEEYNLESCPIRIRIGDCYLFIDKLFLQTPASDTDTWILLQLAFAAAGGGVTRAAADDTPEHLSTRGPAVTVAVDDDWTVIAGLRVADIDDEAREPEPTTHHVDDRGTVSEGAGAPIAPAAGDWTPPGLILLSLPDLHIAASALGIQAGASIKRIADGASFGDCFVCLVDIGLFGTNRTASGESNGAQSTTPVSVTTHNGRPFSMVFREIGWRLGEVELGGVSFPDGTDLVLFSVLRLTVDDLGWVAENNGGYYFFFSGGITFDFRQSQTQASSSSSSSSSGSSSGGVGGITFDRLRFKVSGAPSAPAVMIDGIALDIEAGTFKLKGFGSWHQGPAIDANGIPYTIEELGLGLNVELDALATTIDVGVQFFYGNLTYADPSLSYKYWLAAAQFTPIPIGPYQLVNIRALVAQNLDPHTVPNDAAPTMPLLKWYRDHAGEHGEGLSLPEGRQFGDIWLRENNSFSLGIGAGLTFPGAQAFRIDLFVFYHQSPLEEGLLILLQLFMLHGTDPIAFGALEVDLEHGRWGLVLSCDLNLNTLLGLHCDALKALKITGMLYAGNPPATVALGHLNDQDSWLSVLIDLAAGSVFALEIRVGICAEYVDGGPGGFGFIVSVRGLIDLAILEIEAYLTLGLMVGSWRSSSSAAGLLVWFEAGLRIRLFFVFTFGISGRLQYEQLSSSPGYSKLWGDFHVETPFFLPSIDIHFEQVWDEPHPEQILNLQPPLAAATALAPRAARVTYLPITPLSPDDLEDVPGGTGKRIKAVTIYSIDQLRAAPAPDYAGQVDAAPVGIDSTIALDFKPSVDDRTGLSSNTFEGASLEPADPHASELSLTYELVSVAIQRRPLYGPGAGGAWQPLLSGSDTALFDPEHPDTPNPHVLTSTTLSYDWDGTVTSAGHTDPRRLLLNADTPFTVVTSADGVDEAHVRGEKGWPCRPGGPIPEQVVHVLAFDATAVGTRALAQPLFSESASMLGWATPRPPVVGAARWISTSRHVARVAFASGPRTLATLAFDQLVQQLDVVAGWAAQTMKGTLYLTGYRGTEKVAEAAWSLSASAPATLSLSLSTGFSSATLHVRADSPSGAIELLELRYIGLREEQQRAARQARADAYAARLLGGDGKLGWLANHEYEVALQVRASSTLAGAAAAPQTVLVEQRTRFVTKGLLGLNAVARTGDEVQPYVESTCPGPGLPIYGSEPIALAFTPGMNILAPLDRAPAPTDPDERAQLLRWALTVDQVNAGQPVRVSQTAPDWILSHRVTPPPILALGRVLDGELFAQVWRHAPPIDPMRLRLDKLLRSPDGCAAGSSPRLERSQVLEHQPYDPATGEARWTPGARFIASLRREAGPCVDRAAFEPGDETAFAWATETGTPAAWTLDTVTDPLAGALVAPTGTGRHFALFGELDWNHVVIRATLVPPDDGQAGIALAVDGTDLGQALLAMLVAGPAGTPPRLQLFARTGGATTELVGDGAPAGGVALATAADAYDLEVTAYDDRVRVSSGSATIEVARGALRDGKLALVATAGTRVKALRVQPLDALTFAFTASRYATFEDHIYSFTGEPAVIAADDPQSAATATVAALFTADKVATIAPLIGPDGDADERQARFDDVVRALALPLRRRLARLELTRLTRAGATELLLVESPEPLPLGFDVTCELVDRLGVSVPLAVLPDGTRTRALLVPVGSDGAFSLPDDRYELTFRIDRERYRGDLPDARLTGSATLGFGTPSSGVRPFIHVARTVVGDWTLIQPPVSARDAVLLATPLWNPGGSGGTYLDHPIGVYYTSNGWAVFCQDLAAPPVNAAFNLAQVAGTVHRATSANTSGNVTRLDLPETNGKPHAIVVVTPNWNPAGGGGGYVNHRLGVYYDGSRWAIFNQDLAAMTVGTAFNVFVPELDAFVHTSAASNIAGDYTLLDAPGLANRPDAVLIVTSNWNPGGSGGAYHDKNLGVFYTAGRWAIFNQDRSAMPVGRSFNVWLVGYASVPPP